MKVKDLIEQLKDIPPDTDVYIWNDGERLEAQMVDDSFVEDHSFIDINIFVPTWAHSSIFIVRNHNDTELGRFATASRAQEEANQYMNQTGNSAYIEEVIA